MDARTNIFNAYVAFERGLLHELRRLVPGPAEKQRPAGGVNLIGQVANGAEPGSVDGGHISQAQNDDRRERL
jgi:hypothetical protein